MFKPLYVLRALVVLLVSFLLIDATVPENAVEKRKKVEIMTVHGKMVVELYNETPIHRDNFLKLAKEGFYNDLLFHRVISGFMLQGGDPDSKDSVMEKSLGKGGPGYTLPAEIISGMVHTKGSLAAARRGGSANPEKRSSGSQFYVVQGRKYSAIDLQRQVESKRNRYYQLKSREYFAANETPETNSKEWNEKDPNTINAEETKLREWVDAKYGPAPVVEYTTEQLKKYEELGGTPHLDGEYTVFGEIIEGLDVIDKIAAIETGPADRPLVDIKMTIRVIE